MEAKIVSYVALPGIDAKACYVIERVGQCPADCSDRVQVQLSIGLPVAVCGALLPAMTFGGRVAILGHALTSEWGSPMPVVDGTYRQRTGTFTGDKYSELMRDACLKAQTELRKLTDAMDARQQALRDAEAP